MVNPTGNTAALLNDITGSSSEAMNKLSDFLGALADLGGAIGIASAVVGLVADFLGIDGSGAQDALAAISAQIEEAFHQLNEDLAANQILTRNQAISNLIFSPEGSYPTFQGLKASVRLLDLNPPQLSQADAQTQIRQCVGTCDGFIAPIPDFIWNLDYDWCVYFTDADMYLTYSGYWLTRVNDPGSHISKGYVEYVGKQTDVGYGIQAPPKNLDGATVFAYSFALPTYLTAISVFVSVGLALDSYFVPDWRESLAQLASDLLLRHDKISKSIIPLSPSYWTMASITPGVTGIRSIWRLPVGAVQFKTNEVPNQDPGGGIIEYGAVEKFSGCSSIESNYIVFTLWSEPSDDAGPFNKLQLRVLQKQKEVYLRVGLLRVWNVINQLRQLIGQPSLQRPNVADWSFRRDVIPTIKAPLSGGGWSLKGIASFIEQTEPRDTPLQSNKISFRQLLNPIPTPHPPRFGVGAFGGLNLV